MNVKPHFIKTLEEFRRPRDERTKNRIYAFLICLVVSLGIWFIIKMSKEYYSDIEYPIQYTSLPQGRIMTNIQDSTIELKIQSKGFSLFNAIYFKKKDSFKLSLKNIDIHANRYSTGHYLLANEIITQVRSQFKTPGNIVSISPDTIFFQLEQIASKEVPVRVNLTVNTKKQFGIYGQINYINDTLIITGPPSIIDTVDILNTKAIKLQGLDHSREFKIAILQPIKSHVNLSVDSVTVIIPVEKFTEMVLNLPISLINQKQRKIRLFPNEVKVTFLVALKDFQTVNTDLFEAQINFNPSRQRTQKVELNKHPSFVKISRIDPNIVEYIILK